MPEFKKEGRGFKMKGFAPFTQKTNKTDERVFGVNQEKYDKWNRLKNRGKGPDVRHLGAKENMSHLDKYLKWKTEGAKFIAEDGSPMKQGKTVPSIPVKDKTPAATVSKLQKKKDKGTITAPELKKLRKLRKMMETGPGSYGNEQWDKE